MKGSENIPLNSSGSLKVASQATSALTAAARSTKQPTSLSRQTNPKRDLSNEPPRRSTANVNELQGSEPKKARASYGGQLATPDDFMASIRGRPTPEAHHVSASPTPLTNNVPETNLLIEPSINNVNTAPEVSKTEVAVSKDAAHVVDLIELNNGSETTQRPNPAIERPSASNGITEASQESPAAQDTSSEMEIDPFFDTVTTMGEAGMLKLYHFKPLLTYIICKEKQSFLESNERNSTNPVYIPRQR